MTLRRSAQHLVAVLATVVALALATPAGAVGNPDYTAPPPAEVTTNGTAPAGETAAAPVGSAAGATPDRQWLPITGSDVVTLAAMGAVLVAGGAGFLVLRRRAEA
jgi:LPXTG-motif cell wall-anchored protein